MTDPRPHPATQALAALESLQDFNGKNPRLHPESHRWADEILLRLLSELGHGKVVTAYQRIWKEYE